jgi:hypothetical protein
LTGAIAQFSSLDWGFFVYMNSNLRFTVWSGDSCIGSAIAAPNDIMHCPVDHLGVCELQIPLFILAGKVEKSTGKLSVKFNLEAKIAETSKNLDRSLDKIIPNSPSYVPLSINIEPPMLITLYTISIMDLLPAHRFSKNSPYVKVTCGKFIKSTLMKENAGESAKWENFMWSIFMNTNHKLKFTVLSGSVVLGSISLIPQDLIKKPVDKYGQTEFEGYFSSGNDNDTIGHRGRLRILCRLEAHNDEDEANYQDDSDEDNDVSKAVINLNMKDNRYKVPSLSAVSIIGISLRDLKSVHILSPNSPYVRLECGSFIQDTNAQYMSGRSAQWLDLKGWSFSMSKTTFFRITAVSGSILIGAVAISTTEIYEQRVDDNGHR